MNNKISEFYAKVTADENLKAKLEKILGGKEISEASDAQLKEIGGMAKEMGYDFTIDEVKEFIASGEVQLSDDALDAVAGGVNKGKVVCEGKGAGVYETISGSKG
jgi:predicted ribosomally synthesized peptide with nif11-like leader